MVWDVILIYVTFLLLKTLLLLLLFQSIKCICMELIFWSAKPVIDLLKSSMSLFLLLILKRSCNFSGWSFVRYPFGFQYPKMFCVFIIDDISNMFWIKRTENNSHWSAITQQAPLSPLLCNGRSQDNNWKVFQHDSCSSDCYFK